MLNDKLQKQIDSDNNLPDTTPEQSRRRLLKKTLAIPVIMTLSSGAALARSSNFAGKESSLSEAAGDEDNLYCMDHEGQIAEGAYDLGDHPSYTLVPRRGNGSSETPDKFSDKLTKRQNLQSASSARKNEDDTLGNVARTDEDILLECDNRGGIFISSGAFASISGKTTITLRNL